MELLHEAEAIPAEEPMKASGESADGDSLATLRAELAELRKELTRRDEAAKKDRLAWEEFSALYPDVKCELLSEEILESVRAGVPPAAAYALYEKKSRMRNEKNRQNQRLSAGSVGQRPESDYYSPEEVRKMSQKEVRANYGLILESMKQWN